MIHSHSRTLSHILGEALGVVDSLFARRVSIQVSSHVLHLHLQLRLCAFGRALEGHVLQEVSHSVVLLRLIATASVNPQSHLTGSKSHHSDHHSDDILNSQ